MRKLDKIAVIKIKNTFQGTTKQIILHSLDIVTYVVPPILPAALTATIAFAERRLLPKKIFYLNEHLQHSSAAAER